MYIIKFAAIHTIKVGDPGNALFGGLVGVAVDEADGAADYYPNLIKIPMELTQN